MPALCRASAPAAFSSPLCARPRQLLSAVTQWSKDGSERTAASAKYGYISTWDTSRVTDMNHLFHGYCLSSEFNVDVGSWDTARVTTMFGMFDECKTFNQDIDGTRRRSRPCHRCSSSPRHSTRT